MRQAQCKRVFWRRHLAPILDRLHFDVDSWIAMVKNIRTKFFHAVGNEANMKKFRNTTRSKLEINRMDIANHGCSIK